MEAHPDFVGGLEAMPDTVEVKMTSAVSAKIRAQAAQSLSHPDILHVHDFGTTAAGDAWIVMELVPGHDLSRHTVEGHLLPVGQVLRIAITMPTQTSSTAQDLARGRSTEIANSSMARTASGLFPAARWLTARAICSCR